MKTFIHRLSSDKPSENTFLAELIAAVFFAACVFVPFYLWSF